MRVFGSLYVSAVTVSAAKCKNNSENKPISGGDCANWQQLYDALGGAGWSQCSAFRDDPCSCNDACKEPRGPPVPYIAQINLHNSSLVGTIPWEVFGGFSALWSLDLGENGLEGKAEGMQHITDSIGFIRAPITIKYLDLSGNNFTGAPGISDGPDGNFCNRFNGGCEEATRGFMCSIGGSGNHYTGCLSVNALECGAGSVLPPGTCCRSSVDLSASDCLAWEKFASNDNDNWVRYCMFDPRAGENPGLSAGNDPCSCHSIVQCDGSRITSITDQAVVAQAGIGPGGPIGQLGPEIGVFTELESLHLTSYTSTIPSELFSLVKLESLNLIGFPYGSVDTGWTGTFPSGLSQLTALQTLTVTSVNMTIPSELSKLVKLTSLSLVPPLPPSHGWTGTLPSSMSQLTALQTIEVWGNLSGLLPALPFDTMSSCNFNDFDQPRGSVVFTCPLPPGAEKCNSGGLTCTPAPTPPPSPLVMYSCNAATGQCAEDPKGTQSPGECISTCKCVTPHNCGQLNGTVACNKVITGCNLQRVRHVLQSVDHGAGLL